MEDIEPLSSQEEIEATMEDAMSWLTIQSYDLGLPYLEAVLEADPEHEEALMLAGYASFMLHEFEDARDYFERQSDPSVFEYKALAELSYLVDDLEGAAAYADEMALAHEATEYDSVLPEGAHRTWIEEFPSFIHVAKSDWTLSELDELMNLFYAPLQMELFSTALNNSNEEDTLSAKTYEVLGEYMAIANNFEDATIVAQTYVERFNENESPFYIEEAQVAMDVYSWQANVETGEEGTTTTVIGEAWHEFYHGDREQAFELLEAEITGENGFNHYDVVRIVYALFMMNIAAEDTDQIQYYYELFTEHPEIQGINTDHYSLYPSLERTYRLWSEGLE